jgi:hypothetical protein
MTALFMQRRANHQQDGDEDDDETFPPGPNYLSRFRAPMTEAEMAEAADDFEQAVIAWLREMEQERDQPSLPGLLSE